MKWVPNAKQQRLLELVISMATGCLMGKGTGDVETCAINLRLIAESLVLGATEGDDNG